MGNTFPKRELFNSIEQYLFFDKKLKEHLNINSTAKPFDPRIRLLLQLIENCNCNNYAISSYAKQLSLSASRLSHLFKAEVGIPLKSYIMLHQVECAFEDYLIGKSITCAALNAWFDSPSHFSATIIRIMGMPASLSAKDSEFLLLIGRDTILLFKEKLLLLILACLHRQTNSFRSISRSYVSSNIFYTFISDDMLWPWILQKSGTKPQYNGNKGTVVVAAEYLHST